MDCAQFYIQIITFNKAIVRVKFINGDVVQRSKAEALM